MPVTLQELIEEVERMIRETGIADSTTTRLRDQRFTVERRIDEGIRYMTIVEVADRPRAWEYTVQGGLHHSPDRRKNFDGRRGGSGPYILDIVRRWFVDLAGWNELLIEGIAEQLDARRREGAMPLDELMELIRRRLHDAGVSDLVEVRVGHDAGVPEALLIRPIDRGSRTVRITELYGSERPFDFDVWARVYGSPVAAENVNVHHGGDPDHVLRVVQDWLIDLKPQAA
jgi:hypothetical protein